MKGLTDQQLLRDYAEHRSEAAFAELVRLHVDLVYSAALRMVCDTHLAKDVTQTVFLALAQDAGHLAGRPVLSGWLHRTAQNISANMVRSDVRRRAREQEAATMNQSLPNEQNAAWEQVAPHLDAALGALNDTDRDAILLRYFERKSARQMAEILATSEEAAQKRVNRAVERLREVMVRRGVTVGAGGLVVVITANAVQAAPIGLTVTISTAAALSGTTFSTIFAATKTIAMTTLQKTIVAAAATVAFGAGIYEANQASALRSQNQLLREQEASLLAEFRQIQTERNEATNRLATLASEVDALKANSTELLQLRREVALLKRRSTTEKPSADASALPPETNTGDQALLDNTGRELGEAIVRGDPTAFDKLLRLAKEEFANFRTNSAGLSDDQRGELSRQLFSPMRAAFDVITKAAIGANPTALNAISGMAQIPEFSGLAIQSLGALASNGNNAALEILLDPLRYGFPASSISSATSALIPSANQGNQQAIDALAAVASDVKRPALWFLAANGLNQAAGSGNPVAVDALIGLLGSTNRNVLDAAISGLKRAASVQNAKAMEALRSWALNNSLSTA